MKNKALDKHKLNKTKLLELCRKNGEVFFSRISCRVISQNNQKSKPLTELSLNLINNRLRG